MFSDSIAVLEIPTQILNDRELPIRNLRRCYYWSGLL